MCRYWQGFFPDLSIVLAYGGTRDAFKVIDWPEKVFIDDEALRTRDHQREFQSYTSVYRAAAELISGRGFDRVIFTEFDQVPLRKNYLDQLECLRVAKHADVLMYGLYRVNDTGYAHFLYHAEKSGFFEQVAAFTCREDPRVVLSAYGFGQYWTADAFAAMAEVDDEVGCYLELWAPTVAHHLGFRVKATPDPLRCNECYGEYTLEIDNLRYEGSWCAHPVKYLWDRDIKSP